MLLCMKYSVSSGFTLVELIITIVAMTILMALGTVSITNLQGQARDKERESDIESIARGLEARYNNGNPTAESSDGQTEKGIYPSVNEIRHAMGDSKSTYTPAQVTGGYLTDLLPGTSKSAFNSPNLPNAFAIICASSCAVAGNQAQINAALNSQDKYIYEPVDTNGNICYTTGCYKFNLYWKDESGTLRTLKSKHQ